MTTLRRDQSEGASYLELAQFLYQAGDPSHIHQDLAQLFRRVIFNVAVGNRDDHLRNHGFLLNQEGWRLAPAFDVNPNIDKAEHVLNLDDSDNRPSLSTVLATAEFYGLEADRAQSILDQVLTVVDQWPDVARRCGISGADISLSAGAFSAHAEFRAARNQVHTEDGTGSAPNQMASKVDRGPGPEQTPECTANPPRWR